MRTVTVRRLGRVPYVEALDLQQRLVEDRKAGRIGDTLLLLEHPHVLTIGVKKDGRAHILAAPDRLAALGVEVFETGRGGDVTYHGPGQLVGYPIIDLAPDRRDVHRYVRDLEEVMIRICADYGVAAGRIQGLSGTWVNGHPSTRVEPSVRSGFAAADALAAKIGAVGVRISRWVTSHGFAFNINADLDFFKLIVPCGIADRGVTSLQALTGCIHPLRGIEDRAALHFGSVFDREVIQQPLLAV